jgi:DNA-binding Xre family transcriptional regulator
MITREDLLKSSEYWTEIIQNKFYNDLIEYFKDHQLSNKDLTEKLGLTKGRVSQILSGKNLNFRIDTLVRLCLTIEKVPDLKLVNIEEFISKDKLSETSIIFVNAENFNTNFKSDLVYLPAKKMEHLTFNPNGWIYTATTSNSYSNSIQELKAA